MRVFSLHYLDTKKKKIVFFGKSPDEVQCSFFVLCGVSYTEPQPNYSAFREASFGHGLLDIKNRTTAVWTWHRNQDGEAVSADSVVIRNKVFG